MADGAPRTLDELLTHSAWVRRVAASLVRNAVDADDVVQSTWLAALQRPPTSETNVAGWLATVARNIVRKRARTEGRRTSREQVAHDQIEATPSPESVVERAELQQMIATLVLDLAEPFRSTLLLHYFEELSPSEIAARQGIPAATVRSRLKRGLDDLRAQLDRANHGKRRAWLAPVAALAARPTRYLPVVWKGLWIMKTKLAIAAAVAFILGTLLFVGGTVARRAHRNGPPPTAAKTMAPVAGPRSLRAIRAWNDPFAPARSAIEGIVRGPDGKPLDGALVGAVPEDSDADDMHVHAVAFATSNHGGRFRIEGLRPGAYAAQATARGLSPAYRSGLIVLDDETVRDVELRLEKGGVTVVGRLHDAGGGVIAGGKLHARRHGEERPAVFTATCDANGACPLTLAKGGYTLVAEADGYAPSKRDLVAMLDQDVDLQLVPAATLRGRVVERSAHAPVPNATVALTASGSFLADSQVVADEGGIFEFRDLAPAEYQLSASKGKLAGRAASAVTISLGAYVGEATIELGPARSISGRVLGPSGPVANATVLLCPARSMGNVIAHVQTAADGRYAIDGLLSGAYQVRAESSRLAPAMRDVVVGNVDESVDLQLDAGSEVSGLVVGKEHQPIAAAVISASVEDGEFRTTSATARTDSNGHFHLDALGAGLLYVSASHPDHGSKDAPPARIAFGEKKDLTLMLDATASVEGLVSWEDGTPAVGVTVRAQSSAGDGVSTQTDASGRYHLAPLAAGVHFVVATREAGAFVPRDPGGRQSAPVTLGSDDHKTGIDLILMRAGHKIAGRVLGPDGTPVADAMVRADAEDEDGTSQASGDPRIVFKKATSGADGSFTIEDLTAGRFTLTASHAGFPNASIAHVSADTMNARVQVKAESVLEGVAVTADGAPVADYALTLFASGAGMMLASHQLAVHDANGAFTLKGLAAGRYDLLAATADNHSGRLAEVSLDDGEHKTGLRIVVSQGTRLRGRVVEYGTGLPIPSAEVTILSVGAPISTSTDGNGVFSVDGLPAGRVAWIAAAADSRQYVYDRIRVTLPVGKPVVDVGAIQLVPGDVATRSAGWTGIFPTNLDGVASVETVAPRSPAALAGVKPGDVLVSVDGISLVGLGFRAIYYFLGGQPGTKCTVGLGGRSVTLNRVPDPQ